MIFIWPGMPDGLRRRGVTAQLLVLWIFAVRTDSVNPGRGIAVA
jgi:hypothetical protein